MEKKNSSKKGRRRKEMACKIAGKEIVAFREMLKKAGRSKNCNNGRRGKGQQEEKMK